jgi:hypothetical protein
VRGSEEVRGSERKRLKERKRERDKKERKTYIAPFILFDLHWGKV